MKQVLIGALLAGIAVYTWETVAHVVLPLGATGVQALPDEDPVIEAMRAAIPEPGLYLIPGIDMAASPTEAELEAWQARYEAGPMAFLVYRPDGGQAMSPAQLGIQFAIDLLAALVAALVLRRTTGSYLGRATLVGLIGVFSWLVGDVPHWNWYRFPSDFTGAAAIIRIVGWTAAGLVLAAVVKPPQR